MTKSLTRNKNKSLEVEAGDGVEEQKGIAILNNEAKTEAEIVNVTSLKKYSVSIYATKDKTTVTTILAYSPEDAVKQIKTMYKFNPKTKLEIKEI